MAARPQWLETQHITINRGNAEMPHVAERHRLLRALAENIYGPDGRPPGRMMIFIITPSTRYLGASSVKKPGFLGD